MMVHASLFSGIGGPEVAAAMLGWTNAFHCEINPFGRAVLDYWFKESESYEDITKTDFRKWRGHIDVLTGGFPCQPFSYAGKRGGQEDERYLWPEMLRAVDEIQPRWVVGENVAGLATMVEGGVLTDLGSEGSLFGEVDGVHRYGLRQRFTIERICSDLEGLGYSVQPMLIPAAACGAPHRRDRIYILASDSERTRQSPLQVEHRVHRRGNTCGRDKRVSQPGKSELGKVIPGFPGDYAPKRRWRGFPTISPLIGGDDGFPDWLVRKALPGFWYEESLKAYGNAIVPQVMYRIFQCIEKLEQDENK